MAQTYGQSVVLTAEGLFVCRSIKSQDRCLQVPPDNISWLTWQQKHNIALHEIPVVFLGSQNRGYITATQSPHGGTGILTLQQRRKRYLDALFNGMKTGFSSLNMQGNLDAWFVERAQSANPYQKQEDNREIELKTLLKVLHEIDERIDAQFLEISGDARVSIKIENQKRELYQLSSGFASVVSPLKVTFRCHGAGETWMHAAWSGHRPA
jgi:hypothetical protein